MAAATQKDILNQILGVTERIEVQGKHEVKLPSKQGGDQTQEEIVSFEQLMTTALTAIVGGPQQVGKDLSKLESVSKSKDSIYSIVSDNRTYLKGVKNSIDTMSAFVEQIANTLEHGGSKDGGDKDKVQLIQLAAGDSNVGNLLQSLQDFDEKSLDVIEKIVTELNNLNSVDLSQFRENIKVLDDDVIKDITTRIDTIKDLYENHIAVAAEAAAKGQRDLEAINAAQAKTNEVIIEGDLPTNQETEAAKESYENIASVIIAGAMTMIIGAIVLKLMPDLPQLAVQFAMSLALYLGAVLVPIMFASSMVNKYGDSSANFKAIADIIATAAFTMIIGALFMKIPDMFMSAMQFTAALSVFLLAVIASISIATRFLQKENAATILEHINNLSIVIATAGAVMVIGALFMKIPDMFKNALLFSAALSVFILSIMLPLALMGKLGGDETLKKNVEGLGKLILAAAAVMTIGALVMMAAGGKFVKNALIFGVVFGIFLAITIHPLILLGPILGASEKVLNEVTRFITVCAMIMTIGALFVAIGGGKFAESAIAFGLLLNLFLVVTILPFILLGVIIILLTPIINSVSNFIIKCAVVMTVGALFMMVGGGKFAVAAIAFGLLLDLFIRLVISPFIKLGKNFVLAFATIYTMQGFIKKSTIMLLLGALFMMWKGGEGAIAAMAFTALLTGFIYAVISPFIVLEKKLQLAYPTLKAITKFILVSTVLLLIGAYFMSKPALALGAMAFTVTLTAFIYGVISPFVVFRGKISQASASLHEIELFVVISTAVLLIGAYFMSKPELALGALEFAALLTAFIYGVISPFVVFKGKISQASASLHEIELFMVVSAAVLGLGALIIATYGFEAPLLFAALMVGFITIMAVVFSILGNKTVKKYVTEGAGVAIEMAFAIGFLGIAVGICNIATKGFTLTQAALLLGVVGIFVGIFALIGIPYVAGLVALGAVVAVAMSAAMAALGGAIIVLSKAADIASKVKDLKGLRKVVGAFFGLFVGKESVVPGVFTMLKIMAKSALVTAAMIPMCIAIKLMANTIADLANLKVAEEWDKNGNPTKFRHLTDKDFKLAAEGVSAIITTLGGAIIDVYGKNPQMFDKPLFRDTPFKRVVDSSMGLAELISKLARAVADYANLKVAEAWDKNGNPTKFRHLTQNDFKSASENIQLLVTTMAASINEMLVNSKYKKVVEIMLDSKDGFLGIGRRESTFSKLVKGIQGLGKIISTIAHAVHSYANQLIPTKWNKDGNPVDFRQLSNDDYKKASESIVLVITTLVNGINKLCTDSKYKKLRDIMLDGSDGFLGIGKKDSTFKKIMASTKEIGGVIATIGDAVAGYAKMQIPVKWNKDGKPIEYKTLSNDDFTKASDTVVKVITTIVDGINKLCTDNKYKKLRDIMLDGSQGFLGIGKKDSTFKKIMASTKDIGGVISTIGDAVAAYAKLQIPTKWNKDGQPIEFKTLSNDDFTKAADNIVKVITTVVDGINTLCTDSKYEGLRQIMLDGSKGFLGIGKKDSTFKQIMASTKDMGGLISTIADAVAAYALMLIPSEWDSEGKPIKFTPLNTETLTTAATNIATVVSTVVDGIGKICTDPQYANLRSMMLDSSGGFLGMGAKDSTFKQVMTSTQGLGELINGIADAIVAYATMRVPNEWDENGKPKGWLTLGDQQLTDASKNMVELVTLVVQSFADFIGKPENGGLIGMMLETRSGFLGLSKSPSKFAQVMQSTSNMGTLITGIAESIKFYASMQIPDQWDKDGKPIHYYTLSDNEKKEATKNIVEIVSLLVGGIGNWINKGGPMIDTLRGVSKVKTWWGGTKETGNSTFIDVVTAAGKISTLISSLAQSIQTYAAMKVPTKWDSNGNPIEFMILGETEKLAAVNNIVSIITTLVGGISDFVNDPKNDKIVSLMTECSGMSGFWGSITGASSKFGLMINGLSGLGKLISSLAFGVANYANMKVATEWDKNGKPIKFDHLKDDDFIKAAQNIGLIMSSLGQAMTDFIENNPKLVELMLDCEPAGFIDILLGKRSGKSQFQKVIAGIMQISRTVGSLAFTVGAFASMKVATKWNNDGTPIEFRPLDENDFTKVGENVHTIISALANAVSTFIDENPKIVELMLECEPKNFYELITGRGSGRSTFSRVLSGIYQLSRTLGSLGFTVACFSVLRVPTKWNKDGKPIDFRTLNDADFVNAGKNVSTILSALGNAVTNFIKDNPEIVNMMLETNWGFLFGSLTGNNSKFAKIVGGIYKLGTVISTIGRSVARFAALQYATEYNSKGKAIKWATLKTSDFENAGKNISTILSTLGCAVNKFIKDNPETVNLMLETDWNGIIGLITGGNSKFGKVVLGIKHMGTIMSSLARSVARFAALQYATEYNSKGKAIKWATLKTSDFAQAGRNVSIILATLGNAVNDFITNNPEVVKLMCETEWESISIFGIKFNNQSSTFAKVVTGIKQLGTIISSLAASVSMFASMKYATEYDRKGNPIKWANLSSSDFDNAATNIYNIVYSLTSATMRISELDGTVDFDRVNEIVDRLSYTTQKIGVEVKTIWDEIEDVPEFVPYAVKLMTVFDLMEYADQRLRSIFGKGETVVVGNSFQKFFGLTKTMTSYERQNTEFAQVSYRVDKLFNVVLRMGMMSKIAEDIKGEAFLNVSTSLTYLEEVAKKIDSNTLYKFDRETKITERFVKSIDTIKVTKVMALTKLLEQMTKLSDHMGDLDKFTKVLAEQLSTTLMQLTKQIRDAQRTIKDADRIQRQRHELIDNSIAKVQKMMEGTLQVNVTSTSTGSETSSTVTEEER